MRAVVIHAPHDLRVEEFSTAEENIGPRDVRVRIAAGGICGSDLHYFHQGGFGTVRLREPMALGHEVAGHIEAVGPAVSDLSPGDLVAVNPSVPCGQCSSCLRGERNHCEHMKFNGSAMRFPHVQGMFRERMTVAHERACRMDAAISAGEAALCEPFAVALHAVQQAGKLTGKTVLISGCGPIGVLVIVAARLAGAKRIVATDITGHSLAVAERFGASDCIDVAKGAADLAPFLEGRGQIDVCFECSGNGSATAAVVGTLKPKGRMVLVGLGGDCQMPVNMIVAKELVICGTFRFDEEFSIAADLISRRVVDLRPMISATYPMDRAAEAFIHASDRKRATKVQLDLAGRLSHLEAS
jgi:L-idonate 5-dehydrogenase